MESHSSGPLTVSVTIATHFGIDHDSHVVGILGSIPELGNWHPESTVLLVSQGSGIWRTTLPLPTHKEFEWKLVLFDKFSCSIIRWEESVNRRFKITDTCALSINCVWGCPDMSKITRDEGVYEEQVPGLDDQNRDTCTVNDEILVCALDITNVALDGKEYKEILIGEEGKEIETNFALDTNENEEIYVHGDEKEDETFSLKTRSTKENDGTLDDMGSKEGSVFDVIKSEERVVLDCKECPVLSENEKNESDDIKENENRFAFENKENNDDLTYILKKESNVYESKDKEKILRLDIKEGNGDQKCSPIIVEIVADDGKDNEERFALIGKEKNGDLSYTSTQSKEHVAHTGIENKEIFALDNKEINYDQECILSSEKHVVHDTYERFALENTGSNDDLHVTYIPNENIVDHDGMDSKEGFALENKETTHDLTHISNEANVAQESKNNEEIFALDNKESNDDQTCTTSSEESIAHNTEERFALDDTGSNDDLHAAYIPNENIVAHVDTDIKEGFALENKESNDDLTHIYDEESYAYDSKVSTRRSALRNREMTDDQKCTLSKKNVACDSADNEERFALESKESTDGQKYTPSEDKEESFAKKIQESTDSKDKEEIFALGNKESISGLYFTQVDTLDIQTRKETRRVNVKRVTFALDVKDGDSSDDEISDIEDLEDACGNMSDVENERISLNKDDVYDTYDEFGFDHKDDSAIQKLNLVDSIGKQSLGLDMQCTLHSGEISKSHDPSSKDIGAILTSALDFQDRGDDTVCFGLKSVETADDTISDLDDVCEKHETRKFSAKHVTFDLNFQSIDISDDEACDVDVKHMEYAYDETADVYVKSMTHMDTVCDHANVESECISIADDTPLATDDKAVNYTVHEVEHFDDERPLDNIDEHIASNDGRSFENTTAEIFDPYASKINNEIFHMGVQENENITNCLSDLVDDTKFKNIDESDLGIPQAKYADVAAVRDAEDGIGTKMSSSIGLFDKNLGNPQRSDEQFFKDTLSAPSHLTDQREKKVQSEIAHFDVRGMVNAFDTFASLRTRGLTYDKEKSTSIEPADICHDSIKQVDTKTNSHQRYISFSGDSDVEFLITDEDERDPDKDIDELASKYNNDSYWSKNQLDSISLQKLLQEQPMHRVQRSNKALRMKKQRRASNRKVTSCSSTEDENTVLSKHHLDSMSLQELVQEHPQRRKPGSYKLFRKKMSVEASASQEDGYVSQEEDDTTWSKNFQDSTSTHELEHEQIMHKTRESCKALETWQHNRLPTTSMRGNLILEDKNANSKMWFDDNSGVSRLRHPKNENNFRSASKHIKNKKNAECSLQKLSGYFGDNDKVNEMKQHSFTNNKNLDTPKQNNKVHQIRRMFEEPSNELCTKKQIQWSEDYELLRRNKRVNMMKSLFVPKCENSPKLGEQIMFESMCFKLHDEENELKAGRPIGFEDSIETSVLKSILSSDDLTEQSTRHKDMEDGTSSNDDEDTVLPVAQNGRVSQLHGFISHCLKSKAATLAASTTLTFTTVFVFLKLRK